VITMLTMIRKPVVFALLPALALSGCCCWEKENRDGAVTGGLLGAAGGAIIGAMTGSWVWGALIGAGTGALAGYVIADNSQKYRRSPPAHGSPESEARSRGEADREFQVAMDSKDSATANYHLRRSIEIYPTPAAHNNLGLLQLQGGEREAARASFRQAILLDPGYEPALNNLERLGS
jgi:osmotically inducible lipoprotein OsmB